MRIDRPVSAEVQAAVDLVKLRDEWERACGREDRAEKSLAEVRLEKGRILVEARKAFPARGPNARGWGELLARWRIPQQTAWEYMRLAGYVEEREEISPSVGEIDIPTREEAGIAKPKAKPEPKTQPEPEIEDDEPEPPRAVVSAPNRSADWMARIERLAEELQRHTKAMFSVAQELDALCSQYEASVGSPSLMTARSMLAGVKASVADALQLMGGSNGRE